MEGERALKRLVAESDGPQEGSPRGLKDSKGNVIGNRRKRMLVMQ